MAWNVETNHYMQLAIVTLWGGVDVAERGRALDDLLARLDPGRQYRVLVDMIGARPGLDPADKVAGFIRRLAAEADARGWRVAYLCPVGSPAQPLVEPLADMPGVAFRRFDEGNEAMDWLLAPAPRLERLPPVACHAPPLPAPRARGRLGRWLG